MFGLVGIFLDVLVGVATKIPGSSRTESNRTKQTKGTLEKPLTQPEAPLTKLAELPTKVAETPAKPAEPLAKSEERPTKLAERPAMPAEPPAKPTAKADDLRRIEGIGPKISSVLKEAGITTFSQLAASRVEHLKQILAAAGIGALADPSSWPQQARLAEAGDWEAFQKLKDDLAGGRRS
jgi:predicted flap endonuclease-1-like 5' DNA nuclease